MEQDKERDDSVFDFLYVNRGKLSSLTAQLSDDGLITSVKRTSSHAGSNVGAFKVTAVIAGGEGTITDQAAESLERQFDSSGLLAINSLTVLQEAELLHEGLPAALGQIVLFKGTVFLQDLSLTKRLWSPVSQMLLAQEKKNRKQGSPGVASNAEEMKHAGAILKELPDYVQLHILCETDTEGNANIAWGIIADEDPAFNPVMIGLKHGPMVQGEWHIVAIVDALPDLPQEFPVGDDAGMFWNVAFMTHHIRTIIGRPHHAFGITPLAIFRSHPKGAVSDQNAED